MGLFRSCSICSRNEVVIQRNEELIQTFISRRNESEELQQTLDLLSCEQVRLESENAGLQTKIAGYSRLLQEKDKGIASYEAMVRQCNYLREREHFLAGKLIDRMEVLNGMIQNPRFVKEGQWPDVMAAVNLLYENYTERLQKAYPLLTEEDMHYRCLLKLQLSTSAIATLTGISPASVTTCQTEIKQTESR